MSSRSRNSRRVNRSRNTDKHDKHDKKEKVKMPKNPHHVEEDYLEVDAPLPGQNFVCLSFVSPEKTLMNKEKWFFYHYHQYVIKEYNKIFNELMDKMLNADDGEDENSESVSFEKIIDLKTRLTRVFNMNEVDYTKWEELYDDYMFREEKNIGLEFDKLNNFQTSVRGIKVRGVYDNYKEADNRCKLLQKKDSKFDVFVGQVGYWLPWHPDFNSIENKEYINEELNTLVKEYQKNEEKRDIFYEEQKQSRIKEANEQLKRAKTLQREKEKIRAVDEDEDEDTSRNNDEEVEYINAEDEVALSKDGESSKHPATPRTPTPTTPITPTPTNNYNDNDNDSENKPLLSDTVDMDDMDDPWLRRKIMEL